MGCYSLVAGIVVGGTEDPDDLYRRDRHHDFSKHQNCHCIDFSNLDDSVFYSAVAAVVVDAALAVVLDQANFR